MASHGTRSVTFLYYTATRKHKTSVFLNCVPFQAISNQGDVLNMATMVATITIFPVLLQYM